MSEADAASAVLAPEEHAASAEQGRLDALRALAAREDVDWWLDPALMDPPTLPETAGGEEAEGSSAAPSLRPDPASTAIADELDAAVGERTVLAAPYAGADLVSLRESGAMSLEGAARDAADGVWEARGISPRAQVLGVPGAEADAEALEDMIEVGATAAVVPSSSLRPDPSSAVTPSSVGVYESSRTEGARLSVLAPDPVLSEEFSQLTGDSDAEQTRQRSLAETATIASEYTDAPRHLLISPSAGKDLDPAAAGAVLDALAEAPWIESGRTSTPLDTADQQAWTTDPSADGEEPYALGRAQAEDVHPSGPTDDGTWRVLEETVEAQAPDPAVLEDLEGTWRRLDALDAAMEDDAPLDAARREILGATSLAWRGDPETPAARAQDASERADALQDRIQVVPASGYNVVSDSAAVPITITNGLDTPITVKVTVTSDRPLVQVGEPAVVTVPAHGQTTASVDVTAIANGSVTLTTALTTEDDRRTDRPRRRAADGEPVVGELDHAPAGDRDGPAGRRRRRPRAPHRLQHPRPRDPGPRGPGGARPHGPHHAGHLGAGAGLGRAGEAPRPGPGRRSRPRRRHSPRRPHRPRRHPRGGPPMSTTRRVHRVHHIPRHRRHGAPRAAPVSCRRACSWPRDRWSPACSASCGTSCSARSSAAPCPRRPTPSPPRTPCPTPSGRSWAAAP
ncbi:DUF6049 family protein [Brachybacterium sp. GPGPB12]|uniref:DUF6049 family protein n=1 Tax=Brachybacterium sp. GPGPB12 TaxID=3023517 RepID=UPI0031343704